MFQHILVPVDFAAGGERALELALGIARLGESKVSVLHVIELIADTSFEELEGFYRKLMRQAQARMRALLEAHPAQEITPHVRYGQRVQEIIRFVRDEAVDLIVMRSHKIDPEDPASGWGTISYKVGILAPCPVMLVK